jgi:hypothetical protein
MRFNREAEMKPRGKELSVATALVFTDPNSITSISLNVE